MWRFAAKRWRIFVIATCNITDKNKACVRALFFCLFAIGMNML